jgi:hypothetical protein
LAFVLSAVVAVAGMTLGYVLQRREHQRLGDQVVEQERRAQALRTALQQARVQQARLVSPAHLRMRIGELGLRLTNVDPNQRLFVTLPPLSPPAAVATAPAPHPDTARLRLPLAAALR